MDKDRKRFEAMKHDMAAGDGEQFEGEMPATLERAEGATRLGGRKVAVIVADGFEQVEFDGPVKALREAGATVEVLAEDAEHLKHIHGVNHFDKGPGTAGDRLLEEAQVDDYDALLIPGGAISPDTMRQSEAHLGFVRAFMASGKPVAVICHGPWLLADAGVAEGRTLTSWPAIRKDLERAGATWKDEEVVTDGNLITSRKPDDVPAFSKTLIQHLAEVGTPR